MSSLTIKLSKGNRKYQGGEDCSGVVCLHLKESTSIPGFQLKLLGTEVSYVYSYAHKWVLKSKNEFLVLTSFMPNSFSTAKLPITQSTTINNHSDCLEPGDYEFPFSFALPHNTLPSSAFKKSGVFYSIQAKLPENTHVRWIDNLTNKLSCSIDFQVDQTFDTHKVTEANQPVKLSMEKCFLISTGKGLLKVTGELKKTMLTPGELVTIPVHLSNESMKNVSGITVSMKESVVMTRVGTILNEKAKKTNAVYSQSTRFPELLTPNSNMDWTLDLRVPPEIPQTVHGSLFKREYYLEIIVTVQGFSTNLRTEIPNILIAPQKHESAMVSLNQTLGRK